MPVYKSCPMNWRKCMDNEFILVIFNYQNKMSYDLRFAITRTTLYKVHLITCHEGTEAGQKYTSTLPLTSLLHGGGWVVNTMPLLLYPSKTLGTYHIGGWVGPMACLDGCGKSHLKRDSIPRLSDQ